jgi:hypothetical protein
MELHSKYSHIWFSSHTTVKTQNVAGMGDFEKSEQFFGGTARDKAAW